MPGNVCSPRPRGWSRSSQPGAEPVHLLPAPAGMVPAPTWSPHPAAPAPRARGDGPSLGLSGRNMLDCSPRPRGWSRVGEVRIALRPLLPAPAGMVPPGPWRVRPGCPAPRARGDGPRARAYDVHAVDCSPRPRGWSFVVRLGSTGGLLLPAPAGMVPPAARTPAGTSAAPRARGDGPAGLRGGVEDQHCSPRPRGWSQGLGTQARSGGLLPAPAGMVPARSGSGADTPAAPRARGDGPSRCSTAPFSRPAPRARGDGPRDHHRRQPCRRCSPRPRGWSQPHGLSRELLLLLPAPAGMVPETVTMRIWPGSAPRARGDGFRWWR